MGKFSITSSEARKYCTTRDPNFKLLYSTRPYRPGGGFEIALLLMLALTLSAARATFSGTPHESIVKVWWGGVTFKIERERERERVMRTDPNRKDEAKIAHWILPCMFVRTYSCTALDEREGSGDQNGKRRDSRIQLLTSREVGTCV